MNADLVVSKDGLYDIRHLIVQDCFVSGSALLL
jgi:hypothetical protein